MGIKLTDEQTKIVQSRDRILLIKGAAGSGKTLVGLHRAFEMASDNHGSLNYGENSDEKKKVIFLTFNNTLINDLKDKYKSLFGKEASKNVIFQTYDKYMYGVLQQFLEKTHGGYTMSSFGREYYKSGISRDFLKNRLQGLGYEYSFIEDEFEYIIVNNFSKEEYLEVLRKNRKKRLLKSEREKIYDALVEYQNRINSENKEDGIRKYNFFIEDTLNPIIRNEDYNKVAEKYPDLYEKFKDVHSIIVDESQDFTRAKIMILLKIMDIFKEIKSLTFLYDVSQNLYKNTCFSGITSFKEIGIDGRKSVKSLSFSYRSTRQIHLSAYDMVSKFQDETDKNEIALKPNFCQSDEGVKPFLVKFDSVEEEAELFAKTVERFLKEKNYDPLDILVVPSDNNETDRYRAALESRGIKSRYIDKEFGKECNKKNQSMREVCKGTIRFCNTHTVKGMEAKIIFMLGVNNVSFKDEDHEVAKHYYVQMTRAMEYLFLFSCGEPNKFISAIDKKYLNEIGDEKNIDILDLISAQTVATTEHFQENRVERFLKVAEDCKVAKEQEIKEDRKKEEKAVTRDETLEKNISEKDKIDSYISYTSEKLENLPQDAIKMIGMGLYYYKQGLDIDTAYFKFSKGIEFIIREIYGEKGEGLGTMANNLFFNKDYRTFIQELYRKQIVHGRNETAHEEMKNYENLELIYDYIFREKQIVKFYQKYLDVQNRDSGGNLVEKIGDIFSKGGKVKIGGKEMISHLIDEEEFAVYKNRLKNGEYKLKGEYKESRGQKVFVIKEYKKLEK